MSYFRACRWLAFVAILHGVAVIGSAQPPAGDEEPSQTAPPVVAPKSPPDLYYLPDANGKLVPVPGFRWEEFAELLAIQRREATAAQPPKVVFDQIQIEGEAVDGRATLSVNIDATISDTGWLSMPLRFDQCALLEHSIEGAELRIEPAPEGLGLLAWFRAERAGPVRCELKFLKGLEGGGESGELALNLPRAAKTNLALHVTTPEASAEVADDEGVVTTSPHGQGGTLISVQAVAGRLHLRWSGSSEALASPPTLESTGALKVQLNADGIATEAKLSLRSTSQPLETLQVRLPFGATLLPERQASYTVELLSAATESEAAVAQIRLHEPNTVAEVRIQTRQDWLASHQAIDLGGFAVIGAARQRGYVALHVSEELHAQWEERLLVRQLDELPTALRDIPPLAGFEYSGQPFSLLVNISPRVTRVAIDPQYLVSVTADVMLLKARLKCRVRDGSLHRLKIDLQGWTIDDEGWGPAGLIAEGNLLTSRAPSLTVPFQRPLTGEFELRFEARRPIQAGAGQIEFSLPRPDASLVGQGQLVVLPADNVRLAAVPEAQLKLIAQRPDASLNLPELRQPPQFYRGDVSEAKFAAGFSVRPREIRASVQLQAAVRDTRVAVRQRLKYHIENEAVDRVSLMIPRALATEGNLRLTLVDAEPTPLGMTISGRTISDATVVFLPRQLMGDVEIEASYELPSTGKPGALELPLIRPLDAADVGAELELELPAGLEPTLKTSGWSAENQDVNSNRHRWTAAQSPAQVAIELRRALNDSLSEDLVERAWVQSQLVGERRQDRVVWRVIAPDGVVSVRVPDGVGARDVLAMLDGAPLASTQQGEGVVAFRWPTSVAADAPHILELDYRIEDLDGQLASELPPARLASAGRMKLTLWELLLPSQQHLLAVSSAYQIDGRWEWQGGYWARIPVRSSSDLREWSGGTPRDDLPFGPNRYVLSTVGEPAQLGLRQGARSALVLTSSTLLLVAGLLAMFAPSWLRSTCLLVMALGIVVGLAFAGDLALLLLQSAVPGAVCVAIAMALHSWQHRRRGAVPMLQGSTHGRRHSSFSEKSLGASSTSSHTSRRVTVPSIPGDLP